MSPQARRWLEKVQVQVAAVAALALAWFVAWPLLRPPDPHDALAFLPGGDLPRLAVFAGVVWALSAGCAVLTLTARTEGALLAALVGAAGLALRSGVMRTLLQKSETHLHRTFGLLAAETIAMGAVLVGALLVIAGVRAVAGRLVPQWLWSDPPSAPGGDPPAGRRRGGAANWAGSLVVELAVAVIALVLSFRSTETGQIAFALAGSFFAGAFVAHQTFPVRSSLPFWVAPLLLGVAILAFGGGVTEGGGPAWHQALMVSRTHEIPLRAALPVQWLALGCGGAVAGMWVSQRVRDSDRGEPH